MTIFHPVLYFPQYVFICDDKFNIIVDDLVNINNLDSFLHEISLILHHMILG
jgi:hypothetical protein